MIAIIPKSLRSEIDTKAYSHAASPSWLSPLTSMNVRHAIDAYPGEDVTAFRIKDAMAAISARSISKSKPKIIVRVLPNSKPPKGIPADVKEGVDSWIFPSERLRALYPAGLRNTSVEPPVDADFSGKPIFDASSNYYIWIGRIDGNTDRLKKAIEWANSRPQQCELAVFGTGKAGNVMPAVKLARSIEHHDRIAWMGKPFSPQDCNAPIAAIIQAGSDPSPIEYRLQSEGIPLINID